ncbi:hypothetical protein [Meridianimarinicoccus roseus]|uniref:hypothetical protein n=1 Tax=Meridianimarinicoccus roseus TaxID=2072018 RepID=UPI001EE6843F|nr:hypothetical protein [Meridianimarinicoccus roseus]
MSRVVACAALLAWLAGCGLDGPPTRPAPEPAPSTGIVIGGSGYIGGSVSR